MSKIVVIGGTGLIGSKVVRMLTEHGHEAVAASPNTGVDTLTGAGLAAAFVGASAVLDVSNSPSFADDDVFDFFSTATRNISRFASDTGVGHYIALSVVGAERMTDSGYMRAKVEQERLIAASGVPYSIVHATQFFEFVGAIAGSATVDHVVRLSSALIQPMAAEDVATAVARATVGAPTGTITEVAGPEQFTLAEFVRIGLTFREDPRLVVVDPEAPYFGERLTRDMLLPGSAAQIFETRFADWLPLNPPPAR